MACSLIETQEQVSELLRKSAHHDSCDGGPGVSGTRPLSSCCFKSAKCAADMRGDR